RRSRSSPNASRPTVSPKPSTAARRSSRKMRLSRTSPPLACAVHGSGGVLQLSMRRIHDLVAFCLPYEFEDVVAEVTGADRVEPEDHEALEFARRIYKAVRLATRSRKLARSLLPRLGVPRLTRDYELFLPVFNNAFELFALLAIPDWRKRCRVAACFISEMWVDDVPEYLLEQLARFD